MENTTTVQQQEKTENSSNTISTSKASEKIINLHKKFSFIYRPLAMAVAVLIIVISSITITFPTNVAAIRALIITSIILLILLSFTCFACAGICEAYSKGVEKKLRIGSSIYHWILSLCVLIASILAIAYMFKNKWFTDGKLNDEFYLTTVLPTCFSAFLLFLSGVGFGTYSKGINDFSIKRSSSVTLLIMSLLTLAMVAVQVPIFMGLYKKSETGKIEMYANLVFSFAIIIYIFYGAIQGLFAFIWLSNKESKKEKDCAITYIVMAAAMLALGIAFAIINPMKVTWTIGGICGILISQFLVSVAFMIASFVALAEVDKRW